MKKILKKKNIKYYLIYYAIIELMSGFGFIRGIVNYFYGFLKMTAESQNVETFIKLILVMTPMLIVWLIGLVFMTLPVTIVLLARKTVDDTHERQNKKYTSRENIIYYREKLNKVSPTTISLMQNLGIEEEKDLTATIMKLQLNSNIQIEGDTIKIVSDDVTNLTPNEKHLFNILKDGKITKNGIEEWKNIALEEAKVQGYIKDKNSATGIWIKKIVLIIVFILFILGFKHFEPTFGPLVDEAENMGITEDMGILEVANSENFDYILNVSFQGIVLMICGVGILAWPIFYIVYIVRYQNKNNSLKRTVKGEKLTDEILGMKRFIHDFSMLNEADKDHIVLWDDFLVYAIVLEENEKVIEEILEVKNVKKLDSKMIVKD